MGEVSLHIATSAAAALTEGQMNAEFAACGAYLLVAFADARFDQIEEARFLGGVVNDRAFSTLSSSALADAYNQLKASLERDYDSAEAEILAAIRTARGDVRAAAAVKIAARQAVIADREIKPQEEVVLARIAEALGVSAKEL
jgi:tellurite resistance protein